MLDKTKKVEFLKLMEENLEKKIYNFELEIRLLERKKILSRDSYLITLENLIISLKNNQKSEEEKLELVQEEIKKFS